MFLNKLGCSTIHYDSIGYVYEEAIRDIARVGYRGVELHPPPPPKSDDKAPVRRLLAKLNLKVAAVTCQRWNWADRNTARVQDTISSFKKSVLLAQYLDANKVLTETGPVPKGIGGRKAFVEAAQNIARACDFASDHGIENVLLECVPPPFNYIVDNTKKFLNFRKICGASNLYANVDASNYLMAGENPEQVLKIYGTLVKGIHVKDGKRKGGQWTPIGKGKVNWPAFLQTAKEIGYDDWLVVEYEGGLTGKYYSDPEKASADSFRFLKKLLLRI